ncbi:GNAT family N-acetyltransferase [Micrococcus sp.]|uniref:GNAT family N-acetyltransferase n=1 Tax=Micrococcus sp. TaxID=1271 RepID=UPI002A914104|nr:GNAT family N-acetyltransferase [Micrococcus sp.]MDY6056018.1 GNAT family N-acetyltransferase [Micrococcus sp.]
MLRRATAADLPAVLAMKNLAWRETYGHLLSERYLAGKDEVLPLAVEAWTDLLDQPGTEVWLAEEAGGTVVGMATAGPAEDEALGPDGRELVALYVLARRQGTGLGHRLLEAALADAPARLDVLVGNDRAVRFYERHGFRAEGEPVALGGPWGSAREQRMVRGGARPGGAESSA